ncbi:MAG: hypothetical protein J6V87_07820 [Prevotella sp.]|nr:hypothetical protein [Prevotella sp.]
MIKQVIDLNRLSKQEYQKPEIKVVLLQQQSHILAGSPITLPINTTGLDEDPLVIFDETGGIPGNAW